MKDPYSVLGVAKTASADEIRKAYRRLAKQNHPDLHPGDKDAEARFKEISAAHSLLSDAEQRKRYDAGDKVGYLQANLEYALQRPELANRLRPYLKDLASRL